MKIVLISDWYSENMGYSENLLPKALADLGHEVHLITTNAQVYFDSLIFKKTYEKFLGPPIVDCGIKKMDGYLVHRLPFVKWRKNRLIQIKGLSKKLLQIKPDIVQVFEIARLSTFQAALISHKLRFKLFGECHIHASVFFSKDLKKNIMEVIKWLIYKNTIGHYISKRFVKCYPISIDAANIAIKFFGISKHKIKICSLGVDTEIFRPLGDNYSNQIRREWRAKFGFNHSDIVCVYTGRLTEDKDPLCLAKAIDLLNSNGYPFKGLFVGNGSENIISSIKKCQGCVIHPFVSRVELRNIYWSADIGVWPKQESISQLDAAACGLPLVLSNKIQVLERIEGNGLLYEEGDYIDLANKILSLQNRNLRRSMGLIGSKKVLSNFSWRAIALNRVVDYEKALNK